MNTVRCSFMAGASCSTHDHRLYAPCRIKINVGYQAKFHRYSYRTNKPPYWTKNGTNTRERMAESLIRILSDGPEVSLSGSPTVSPTTAALCVSVPLPPRFPASIYFLALSQAPPLLDEEMAITPPATRDPARTPATA